MQVPLQITFRHMEPSAALEAAIRDHIEKLEEVHPRLGSCRVVIERVAGHQQQGKLYSLHLDLKYPGHEIAINRDRHEDAFVALRTAFDAAKRRLADEAHIQRGDVKTHPVEQPGTIAALDGAGAFGFLEGSDATRYYFSADNLNGVAFSALAVGMPVRFIAEFSGDTPQAKRVVAG